MRAWPCGGGPAVTKVGLIMVGRDCPLRQRSWAEVYEKGKPPDNGKV